MKMNKLTLSENPIKGNDKTKKIKKVLLIFCIILVALIILFFAWASFYYKADDIAHEILNASDNIEVDKNIITITPTQESSVGFIFYPGAQVEAIAYLPLLTSIVDECNVNCYLIEMPLNLAVFDVNAAEAVIADNPEIDTWYMAGHSLGGSMASSFASDNEDTIDGLIVLGSYVYGDYPTKQSLTVYGTFNSSLEDRIDYTDNIVIIDGGNHAQFGDYGAQLFDPQATITAQEQQEQTVEAVFEFINSGYISD